jgi:hypothetical protein
VETMFKRVERDVLEFELVVGSTEGYQDSACQIASNRDPSFACKNEPLVGTNSQAAAPLVLCRAAFNASPHHTRWSNMASLNAMFDKSELPRKADGVHILPEAARITCQSGNWPRR